MHSRYHWERAERNVDLGVARADKHKGSQEQDLLLFEHARVPKNIF